MSKARELADLGSVTTRLDEVGNTDGALSNRNLIINGAMQVAQRGTSFTGNGYGLDRWKTYNSGGTATLSQQTFASGDSPEVGLDTYVRIVRASPSGIYYFSQRVEDVRKSDGATLTLSFYGKASSATTVGCRITQEFGSGGSSGVNITAQNNNLTTSWQRFSMTFNMASLSGKTIGTGSNFEPVFDIPATTATIEITGVQLEVGDTATPFEHRSFGDELARCQRYYQKIGGPAYTGIGSGINFQTITRAISFNYLTEMRANPSGSIIGTLIVTDRTSFDTNVSSIASFSPSTNSATIQVNKSASSGTNYIPVQLAVANGTTSYIALDAEL